MGDQGKHAFEQEFTNWLGTRSFTSGITVSSFSLKASYRVKDSGKPDPSQLEHLSAVRKKLHESGIVFNEVEHGKPIVVSRQAPDILPLGDDCVTITIDASQFPKLTEVLNAHVRAAGDAIVENYRREFEAHARDVNAEVVERQGYLAEFANAHSKINSAGTGREGLTRT
jgi:hypothetical protein